MQGPDRLKDWGVNTNTQTYILFYIRTGGKPLVGDSTSQNKTKI